MQFIADIISNLPDPWNYIIVILILLIMVGVLMFVGSLVNKIFRKGINVKGIELKGDTTPKQSKNIVLTEDSVETMLRVFITTISSTIEKSRNKRLASKMEYLIGKLGTLYTEYKSDFYKILKSKGIDERLITNHDDYITYDLSLRTALYLQNGVDCFKSVIRDELKYELYRDKEGNAYDEFLKNVGSRLRTTYKKAFEASYRDSSYYSNSQELGFRLVPTQEAQDMFDRLWPTQKDYIKDIFDFAKEIDDKLDKEEKTRFEENIQTIKSVLVGDTNEN